MVAEADFRAAWVAELDRLELTVAQAEALLRSNDTAGELEPWEPPVMRGVLPSDLLPRARLLHERQLAVANLVAERVLTTARHRAYAGKVRENTPPAIPVYLDVSA